MLEELLPARETEGGKLGLASLVPRLMGELLWLLDEDEDIDDLSLGAVLADETVTSEGVVEIEVEVETCCERVSVSLIE